MEVLKGVYEVLSGMFETRKEYWLGELTEEELKAYDGSDPNKPLLTAMGSIIYDVSGSEYFEVGGPFALFVGKECLRAVKNRSFYEKDINDNLEAAFCFLIRWNFIQGYAKVGQLKKNNTKEVEVTEEISNDGSETTHGIIDFKIVEDTPSEQITAGGSEAADSIPAKAEEPKENGIELEEDFGVTKENACDCNGAKTEPVELSGLRRRIRWKEDQGDCA